MSCKFTAWYSSYQAQQPIIEAEDQLKGIILSGGPNSVNASDAPTIPKWVLQANARQAIPILGICYGMQILAKHFGARVSNTGKHEFGHAEVRAKRA